MGLTTVVGCGRGSAAHVVLKDSRIPNTLIGRIGLNWISVYLCDETVYLNDKADIMVCIGI
jgi:hypothetical protein